MFQVELVFQISRKKRETFSGIFPQDLNVWVLLEPPHMRAVPRVKPVLPGLWGFPHIHRLYYKYY
jgi:hypothetical protein